MITTVDTSIPLDVLTDDPAHAPQSEALLAHAFQQGGLRAQADDTAGICAFLAAQLQKMPPLLRAAGLKPE